MNKQTKIITILVLCLITLGTVFAYDKISESIENKNIQFYQQGVADGQLDFYNNIISSLSTRGEIILPITMEDNSTQNIKLIIAKEETK